MRIVQTRKEVTRLHLLGYTQQAIAEKLGKDQGNISRMLKRIRSELDKDAVNNMGEVRAVQNARLEGILKEYWGLFASGNMDKPETAVAGALKTVAEISKLLGVNINPTQVIDQKITTETVDPDILASKLASVFGDGDVVDGELVQPAALEHDTGDAEDADDDTPDELDAHIADDPIDDADIADAEDPEALDETIVDDGDPEALDAHIADDGDPDAAEAVTEQQEAPPSPKPHGPNPGVVISGRLRPTPNREAEALAAKLAEKFS